LKIIANAREVQYKIVKAFKRVLRDIYCCNVSFVTGLHDKWVFTKYDKCQLHKL